MEILNQAAVQHKLPDGAIQLVGTTDRPGSDYRIALLRELGTGELSGELADLLRDAVAPSLLLRWQ